MLDSDKFFRHLEIVVWQYKCTRMLVALRALNNIIAHRLLKTRCRIPSDIHCHQTTNNFEKLMEQEYVENTAIITIPILLVIHIHIGSTRLLENSALYAEYNLEERLHRRYIGLDWGGSVKHKEALATNNDDKDKVKDPKEKNRQLKREKLYQKPVAAAVKAKTRQQIPQDVSNNQDASLSIPGAISICLLTPGLSVPYATSTGPSNLGSVTPTGLVTFTSPVILTTTFTSTGFFALFCPGALAPFRPCIFSPLFRSSLFFFPRSFRSGGVY